LEAPDETQEFFLRKFSAVVFVEKEHDDLGVVGIHVFLLESDVVQYLLQFVFVDGFASVGVILVEKWLDNFSDSLSKRVQCLVIASFDRDQLLRSSQFGGELG
jgi:hypothetical protein